jgi:hypothetical protein
MPHAPAPVGDWGVQGRGDGNHEGSARIRAGPY